VIDGFCSLIEKCCRKPRSGWKNLGDSGWRQLG